MSVTGAIVTYIVLWFLTMMALLPFGNNTTNQADPDTGSPAGVPETPRLRLKMLIAVGIAAVLWGIVYYVVSERLVTADAITALWGLDFEAPR